MASHEQPTPELAGYDGYEVRRFAMSFLNACADSMERLSRAENAERYRNMAKAVDRDGDESGIPFADYARLELSRQNFTKNHDGLDPIDLMAEVLEVTLPNSAP